MFVLPFALATLDTSGTSLVAMARFDLFGTVPAVCRADSFLGSLAIA